MIRQYFQYHNISKNNKVWKKREIFYRWNLKGHYNLAKRRLSISNTTKELQQECGKKKEQYLIKQQNYLSRIYVHEKSKGYGEKYTKPNHQSEQLNGYWNKIQQDPLTSPMHSLCCTILKVTKLWIVRRHKMPWSKEKKKITKLKKKITPSWYTVMIC